MNSFYKNNGWIFTMVLGMLLNSSVWALTFRNQPLTNFIEPGKLMCGEFPENSIVILEIERDNFDIKDNNIDIFSNLKDVFQELTANRSGSISSSICNISSNVINYNRSYLVGRERMNIHAKTSLKFVDCLLESPFISITGSQMDFVDSFLINPKVLHIIVDYPGSDYDIVEILFYDQSENPTIIRGQIDLNNNETKTQLIISNPKEIRMKFKWGKGVAESSTGSSSEQSANILPNVDSQKVNSGSTQARNSKPSGFVDRSLQAIAAFSQKYITPYL